MELIAKQADDPVPPLTASQITAILWEGLTVQTADGRPATLAIIDENGKVVESGQAVLREAWNVAVLSYRRFLIGERALRVYSSPIGIFHEDDD
jgi:hypothetical protein